MNVTAHRGVSSLAPENTLAAFIKAAELGCEWIELDVQLSEDEIPVVIHDKSVERCTNGKGIVSKMTLHELQALDAGSWFDRTFCEETIPSLKEALQLAQEQGLKVNIELKLYPEDNIALLCKKVIQVITELQIDTSQILFSSFEHQALSIMQTKLPQVRRGQLWKQIPDNALAMLEEINAYSVHCNYRYLNAQQAQLVKQAGYQLYCYTANDPQQVKEYWGWGVDMMISDQPHVYFQ